MLATMILSPMTVVISDIDNIEFHLHDNNFLWVHPPLLPPMMTNNDNDYGNDDDEASKKTYRASLAPPTSVN